jgi:hypothetical protein
MNLMHKIKAGLNNDLKTFVAFQIIIALVCILIPVLLRFADKSYKGFRSSISDYARMPNSYVYGMLLCMAAMLFIYNGAVYFQRTKKGLQGINQHGKWYNVVLGVSLLLVIIFPTDKYETVHYVFSIIFFGGNAAVTAIFYCRKYRSIRILLAILTVVSFALFFAKILIPTIFWAEWLSLTVVSIHFILEAKTASDEMNYQKDATLN